MSERLSDTEAPWWARAGLQYVAGTLLFAGCDVAAFARGRRTPFYLYDVDRVIHRYAALREALASEGVPASIAYAMKANRHPAILSQLLARTDAGVDVCSPNELDLALSLGFAERDITYTGTSLSDRDLEALAARPGVHVNLDSLSSVRRFSARCPSRAIGVRIDPGVGMAYREGLEYAGRLVKFGVHRADWPALARLATERGLDIRTVHCHAGSGFLTEQLARLPAVLAEVGGFLDRFPAVGTVNLGGGLGVPQREGDRPLDLDAWARIVTAFARHRGVGLAFEPGDFLVKDAGVLVSQVTTVEAKRGHRFVGLDAGMNVNNEFAYYDMNLEPVPVRAMGRDGWVPTILAGNINEPIDLFSHERSLPPLGEGDLVALLNAGGYGASSASNHCMRGDFREYALIDRASRAAPHSLERTRT